MLYMLHFLNQGNSLLGKATGRADGVPASQRGVLLHPEGHAVLHVGLPEPAASDRGQGFWTVLGS